MARVDRRQKTALDEAYKYYMRLERGETPDPYALSKAVRTLWAALTFSNGNEFKLTRQLWKRLHQALFDRLITSFAGRMSVLNAERQPLQILTTIPESAYLVFRPDCCRRADDLNEIEFKRLYPKTALGIKNIWQTRGEAVRPSDFEINDCDNGVCYMKPLVVGHEVLGEESSKGKSEAYHKWWDLYWQMYCCANPQQQELLSKQMHELEAVWGNLYY
ncbi:MAG: hypothetical protein K2W82_13080 [Candidatus Obscuribacterales bacterium]|jgi:hypothetical protein|nr:hypothetical protein [Candidatus Obscuribacterales bacterium]